MEIENNQEIEFSDTPEYVKGMIYALKAENYSNSKASDKIKSWGFLVSQQLYKELGSVQNLIKILIQTQITAEEKKNYHKKVKNKFLKVEENCFLNTQEIQRDQRLNKEYVSASSIKRFLAKSGLIARRMPKCHLIKEENKEKRLKFCQDMLKNPKRQKQICFYNESILCANKFQIQWVRKYDGETLEDKYWQKIDKWSQGLRQTVWAIIDKNGLLDIVFVNSKINQDTYHEILDLAKNTVKKIKKEKLIFVQDNACAHKAKSTLKKLEEFGIKVIDWPPQCPDLNPIENNWGIMKDLIWREMNKIKCIEQLNQIKEQLFFQNIQIRNAIKNAYLGLEERFQACVDSNAGNTFY